MGRQGIKSLLVAGIKNDANFSAISDYLHRGKIATYKGEYKYHRRLTDFKVKQIKHYEELITGDVFIVSYPSCITTNYHKDFSLLSSISFLIKYLSITLLNFLFYLIFP